MAFLLYRHDPFLKLPETSVTVSQPQDYYNAYRAPAQDENGFLPQSTGAQTHHAGSQFQGPGSQFQAPGSHFQALGPQLQGGSTQQESTGIPLSRAEKIQQLRADHQRRHRERQGHYPMEDKEEEYERQIQEDERKVTEHEI